MRILHISPSYYSPRSVIGGGEKYVIYMLRAIQGAAERRGLDATSAVLACGTEAATLTLTDDVPCRLIKAVAWNPHEVPPDVLRRHLDESDVIFVHQCLTGFGLFVAAHARLAGKIVIGLDSGGGEHPLVHHTREAGNMYDLFIAYSVFCAASFADLDVPVRTILGPVDTERYRPPGAPTRDPALVAAVGRLLPHKGFDRIIAALPEGLRLVIAGSRSDADYHAHLERLADQSGRDVRIEEGLSDDEVRGLMGRASLFVHASTHVDYRGTFYAKPELLGLAPLEALARGTPTLVSSAGSLGELGAVVGCRVFHDEDELAALLRNHLAEPPEIDPQAIHESVDSLYGPAQFGDRVVAEVTALERAA